MAAATTILAAGAAALSMGKGVSDISKGNAIAREAKRARDNYVMPTLQNVYAGLAVPTSGIEMQKESLVQSQANMAYAAGQAGAKGMALSAYGISKSLSEGVQSIGAQLDQAEFKLKTMMAEDENRIRTIREQRASNDLSSLGKEEAYGRNLAESGMSRIIGTVGSAAELASGLGGDNGDGSVGNNGLAGNLGFLGGNAQNAEDLSLKAPDVGFKSGAIPWQQRVNLNYNFNPNS